MYTYCHTSSLHDALPIFEIGPEVDGLRVIRAGLAPTDRVVINGYQFARPGTKAETKAGKIAADAQEKATAGPGEQIGRAHVELQSLMRISYAVFCLKKKTQQETNKYDT